MSPEEVYTSIRVAGDRSILLCKWLKTELPLMLEQIRKSVAAFSLHSVLDRSTTESTVSMLVSSLFNGRIFVFLHRVRRSLVVSLTQNRSCEDLEGSAKEVDPSEAVVQLSAAEAKQAWLMAGGDTERAAKQALRDRLVKVT